MRLTINQKDLNKALTAASRVASARATIPILTTVRFEATSPNNVWLRATDLDIEVTISAEAKVEQGGEICVPAYAFRDITNKLNAGADVSLVVDDNRLTIKSGRSKFHINTLPTSDWPEIANKETPHRFDIPADHIGQIISKTSFAISSEETRYYLNGIFLHVTGAGAEARLRGVSTDGHRLARYDVDLPAQATENLPGIIIPRKTVAEVERLLKDAPETITIRMASNFIRFEIGSTMLASKIIDGTFPDYARVIPTNADKEAIVDAATLSASVARVSTVSSERGRAVKMSFNGSGLTNSVSNPDMGDAIDEIDCEWKGGSIFEVGFNSKYIMECMDILGEGFVSMNFSDPGSPCLMRNGTDDNLLIVLMPMRV